MIVRGAGEHGLFISSSTMPEDVGSVKFHPGHMPFTHRKFAFCHPARARFAEGVSMFSSNRRTRGQKVGASIFAERAQEGTSEHASPIFLKLHLSHGCKTDDLLERSPFFFKDNDETLRR